MTRERDDLRPDGNLEFYRSELQRIEQEILDARMSIELSGSTAELLELPAWEKLVSRLRTVEAMCERRLRKSELGPYQQGWTHGALSTTDKLLTLEPMTARELDDAKKRITMLEDQLAHYKAILR